MTSISANVGEVGVVGVRGGAWVMYKGACGYGEGRG